MTNNTSLASDVRFTVSDLKTLASPNLKDVGQSIYNAAFNHAPALLEYRVTPEMLSEFQKIVDNFDVSIPEPKLTMHKRNNSPNNWQICFPKTIIC